MELILTMHGLASARCAPQSVSHWTTANQRKLCVALPRRKA
jgi:hypothetical protein